MKHTQLALIALVVAVVAGAALLLRPWLRDDVGWCRRVFTGLAQGSQYIQDSIDWERLKALNADVGSEYRRMPNEEERANYRQAFISQFARGFRQSKAAYDQFTNWRVLERGQDAVVVAADYPAKQSTLLFEISELGGRRLEAIKWQ